MPPKGRKKDANKEANDGGLQPGQLVQRPATPNDFQIVATVRTLQGLVNTESKWKNRLLEAQHLQQIANNKLAKVERMMEQCTEGIEQLDAEVQEICDALILSDHQKPFGPTLTPQLLGTPAPATQASGPGKGPKKKISAEAANAHKEESVNLEALPPNRAEHRREEAEYIANLLKAFYNLPRLAKEEQMYNARPPVSTREGMLAEMDEAVRLATPTAELLAQAADEQKQRAEQQKANDKKVPPKAKTPQPTKTSAGKKGGHTKEKTVVVLEPEVTEEEIHGELNPNDFLNLPVPKGVDPRIMNRILMLRSRKLRLEHCMARFEKETIPLQHRTNGVNQMLALGNYSIGAVAPQISETMEEEASLQRVRVQEDEAWLKTGSTAGVGSRMPSRGESAGGRR